MVLTVDLIHGLFVGNYLLSCIKKGCDDESQIAMFDFTSKVSFFRVIMIAPTAPFYFPYLSYPA